MILEFHFLGFRTFLTRQPFSLHAPPHSQAPLKTQTEALPSPPKMWKQRSQHQRRSGLKESDTQGWSTYMLKNFLVIVLFY